MELEETEEKKEKEGREEEVPAVVGDGEELLEKEPEGVDDITPVRLALRDGLRVLLGEVVKVTVPVGERDKLGEAVYELDTVEVGQGVPDMREEEVTVRVLQDVKVREEVAQEDEEGLTVRVMEGEPDRLGETEEEGERLFLALPDLPPVADSTPDPVREAELQAVRVRETDGEAVTLRVMEGLGDALVDRRADLDTVALGVADRRAVEDPVLSGERVTEGEFVKEAVAQEQAVGLTEGLLDTLGDGAEESEGCGEGETTQEKVALPEATPEMDTVALAVAVSVPEKVKTGEVEADLQAVMEREGEGDVLRDTVPEALREGEAVSLRVPVPWGDLEADTSGDLELLGEAVTLRVRVAQAVEETELLTDRVRQAVAEWEGLGEGGGPW